jgi:hypothetical protein
MNMMIHMVTLGKFCLFLLFKVRSSSDGMIPSASTLSALNEKRNEGQTLYIIE